MTLPATRPVRSTSPRRLPPGSATRAHASDYAALAATVRAAGLLERRYGTYAIRVAVLAAGFAAAAVALLLLGHTWWQLVPATGFGLLFAQTGFLAHDAAHKQVFESGPRNEWFSRVLANLVVGLGYGWWMHKHSRHHGAPNTIGRDTDLDPNVIVFTPDDAVGRTGLAGLLLRRQGWLFLPAMTLTGLDLHVKSTQALFVRGRVQHRGVEAALLGVRLIGFPALVLLVAGPLIGAAFLLVQLLVFGFFLGTSFAPNHIGMPLLRPDARVDHLRRQVLTSRNISGGAPMEIWMGGLNYQIEHHLFPNMPSANLRRARPIVRRHCAELGLPYTETTLFGGLRDTVRYVHRVGLQRADPFDCPAAAALRMA